MIDLKCPICEVNTLTEDNSLHYPNANSISGSLKRILFCSRCDLGVVYPLLTDEELDRLYSGAEYWSHAKPVLSVRRQPVLHALAKSRWSFIKSNFPAQFEKKKSLALLDIGAGYGYLGLVAVKHSKNKLNRYTAIEPDQNLHPAFKLAWTKWSTNSNAEIFSTIEKANGKFDIVALSHVIEHVKNPLDILDKAVSFLTEDGILFIEVPNRDDRFKSNVYPHLLFFSPQSFESLIQKLSLEMTTLEVWGKSYKRSPLNINASLTIKLKTKFLSISQRFLPGWITSPAVAFHFGINKRHPHGTWVRVIARRE